MTNYDRTVLMAELDATAASLAAVYDSLPGTAQAQVLVLAEDMARVRRSLAGKLKHSADRQQHEQ